MIGAPAASRARYERLAELAGFDPRHTTALNDARYLETVRASFAVVFPAAVSARSQ